VNAGCTLEEGGGTPDSFAFGNALRHHVVTRMTRRPKSARRDARPKSAPPKSRRRVRPIALVVGVVVLASAGFAAWRITHRPAPPAPATVIPDEHSAMLAYPGLVALSNRVKALKAQKRYSAVLPGMRALMRQHDLHGGLVSDMVAEYGQMQSNAAFEVGPGAPRSSVERVAYEYQALETFQRALTLAKTPSERAKVVDMIGFVAEMWGFPYDAYLSYRAANDIDPTLLEARQDVARFMQHHGPVAPVSDR
jgi:hypothetical protein